MKNLNSRFTKTFNEMQLSSEKEDYLKEKIVSGYKKKKKRKNVILSVIIVFGILLVGTGITSAKDFKANLDKLIMKVKVNQEGEPSNQILVRYDGGKKINNAANLSEPKCETGIDSILNKPIKEECLSMYSYDELESELDIKLLKSDLFKKNRFILSDLKREDSKITSLKLFMANVLTPDSIDEVYGSWIDMRILINTKKVNIDDDKVDYNVEDSENKFLKYYVKNLDSFAAGVKVGRIRMVYLVYDDVLYNFSIIPSGKARDNPDEEVMRILDSLHL